MKIEKIKLGLLLGTIAGIIDVIPMIYQHLTWDANLSAIAMWIIVGFFIATIKIDIHPILKGIIIAFLVLLPSAILIGWQEPQSLLPISIMTILLGGLLGFLIKKFSIKKRRF